MVGDHLSYANEELITHCLDKKIIDQNFLNQNVHDVDFFLYYPQQLSDLLESLTEQEFTFFDKPDVEYSQAYENKKKRPRYG
ncbi:hypothetical protein H5410_021893 [Solanum commersonii]|uniref:NAC domain-containing protein n=1 Tax=Solanum commersonii TaxID=4109 RepID=A0A9J5ZGK2_SOLCO|nr:hypothetical protein H5410_021893 [Solanum commersonii]